MPQPSLGHARAGLAGATVRGEIFAIGGFSFAETFDVVEARSTGGAGTWREVAPSMPTPRANLSTAVLDDIVYAIGGIGVGDVSLDVVEQYDPATPSWTTGVPLPEPRVAPGAAGLGGRVYVAGGEVSPGGAAVKVTDSVLSYAPGAATWEAVAPMPTPRGRLRLVAPGGHLYAIGGVNQGFKGLDVVERYDPGTDSWATVASMNEVRALPGAVATRSGNRIVVVGGTQVAGRAFLKNPNLTALRSTEIYDIATDAWELHPAELSHGRVSLICELRDDGAVLAIGGALTNGGRQIADLVEALDVGP